MKILYASATSLAGVCALMTRVTHEYTTHQARALTSAPKRHGWYQRPGVAVPTFDVNRASDVAECLEWADVVHCMANVSARFFGRPELLARKIWVFQWHGKQILPWERYFRPGDERFYKFAHIGQGWIEWSGQKAFFAERHARLLPNLITIDDEIHVPLPWHDRVLGRVAFSPSNLGRGVNCKGVEEVQRAAGSLNLDMISGQPFEACMRRKALAQVGIDEVVTPLYHRSGLEFLSLGVPCACYVGECAQRALLDVTGATHSPFLEADNKALGRVLREALTDQAALEALSLAVRSWIVHNYHPRDLINRYVEFYKK